MKKSINPFKSRWQTIEGASQAIQVYKAIQTGNNLQSLKFLQKHQGRWDLRGFVFPSGRAINSFQLQNYDINRFEAFSTLKKVTLSDIDLSYADIDSSLWDGCTWQNVCLDFASAKNIKLWASQLVDVSFIKANLNGAGLGGNSGKIVNRFETVNFEYADMRSTGHGTELYTACDFSYAKLDNVSFEGASFVDCKFSGLLDNVQFFLHSRLLPTELLPWRKINPKKINSSFENVDFSSAVLMGVDFHGVDISSCKLPQDDIHVVVHNPFRVFTAARKIIVNEWTGEDQRMALGVLDQGHLIEAKKYQPIDILNKNLDIKIFGEQYTIKFYQLIADICQSL